ncbi:MAG: HEPN domain-containing protein [Actinomycetota bacterium]|nr:HEPN domain-containing protein [Actinomycetota bacterium]
MTGRFEGGGRLADAQEEVLAQLLGLATQLATAASQDNVPVAMRLEVLGRFDEQAQTSIGNALRRHAGGLIEVEIPDDPVLGPLTALLRDAYPLMLVPADRTFFPRLHLSTALWSSPHRRTLEAAILSDSDLLRLFVTETESGGWTSIVYRSTGSGGTLQLWSLPDLLLTAAWWSAQLTSAHAQEALAAELARLVDVLRRVARGEVCKVRAVLAFTGIVLDGVEAVDLPFGTLRPVREHERDLAPPSLEGMVSHTTPEGRSITASYAGDVVLETEVDYRIAVEEPDPDGLGEWPAGMRDSERLEADLDTVRLASLLVGDGSAMLTLAPTWRMVFDPLSWGPLQSWSDPRTGPSIAPRRLGAPAVEELAEWVRAIHDNRTPSVDVAVRRVISASASRADPVDALVDLVIAWENLFGSRQGEPTLRISAALGWLLGSTPDEREKYRSQASKAYALRSDIVHGNRPVSAQEAAEMLAEARTMTFAALRRLFSGRTALLAMKNGDERSRALIMDV